MSRRRRACSGARLLLAGALLSGCQGLSGRWSGELVCARQSPTILAVADLRLWRSGGGRVEGELRAEGELSEAGQRAEVLLAWTLELSRTEAPGIRQPLRDRMIRCEQYLAGELQSDGCDSAEGDWSWDGEDGLALDGPRCQAELQRGAGGAS